MFLLMFDFLLKWPITYGHWLSLKMSPSRWYFFSCPPKLNVLKLLWSFSELCVYRKRIPCSRLCLIDCCLLCFETAEKKKTLFIDFVVSSFAFFPFFSHLAKPRVQKPIGLIFVGKKNTFRELTRNYWYKNLQIENFHTFSPEP